MPIRIGVQLPDSEGMLDGRTARWNDIAEYALHAEALGFDSLWVQDHFLFRFDGKPPEGAWECFSLLSAVAAATTRVEIGALVACTAFRNPALTAKMADTIDEISGGRFVLGLGAGWHEAEFTAMGLPFDARASRFEEAVQIVSSLLRTGGVDFVGRYHTARDCELHPRGPRPHGPPIMIGGKGDRTAAVAARHGDRWNAYFLSFGNRPSGVAALRARVDGACQDVGRDPLTLERSVVVLVDVLGGSDIPASVGRGVRALAGPKEQIAAELRAYEAEGVAQLQLYAIPTTRRALDTMGQVLDLVRR